MTLHFLDDVFLLYLALETTESVFHRLAFLHLNFCQLVTPTVGRTRDFSIAISLMSLGLYSEAVRRRDITRDTTDPEARWL